MTAENANMNRRSRRDDDYELNHSFASRDDDFERSSSPFDDDYARAGLLTDERPAYPQRASLLQTLQRYLGFWPGRQQGRRGRKTTSRQCCGSLRPTSLRKLIALLIISFIALILFVSAFFPSYTNPPIRYAALRKSAGTSREPGRGNPRKEKVFIAASIFDRTGDLARGQWGQGVLQLIHLLGPSNVYLSVYENDAGSEGQKALEEFKTKVECQNSIVYEEHLDLSTIPHVELPDGTSRVKRIEYLAEVRNRALRPLQGSATRFDKLLYLNDVVFDPVDALHLLFSTNANEEGRAEYRAACAVDFINPFKYYDTFATRDIEGYGIGLPFFPWFTTAGSGASRREVLAGKDNVRVRSCWGGMVAFDARYLQPQSNPASIPLTAAAESPSNITAPYRFRAEPDLYWDASECCLIHADIQDPDPKYSGIFINPYVRVAYDSRTLSWLHLTRRFEKLYAPAHWFISRLVGMPWHNPRQNEVPYAKVEERVWISDTKSPSGGSFEVIERLATHSGFCGRQALQVLKQDLTKGEKNWEFLPVPS